MFDLMRRLSEADGISGFEGEVRDIMRSELEGLVDSIKEDKLGNLITVKEGDTRAPSIMLAAHMDEIGLMVRHITKEGFIKFSKIGGINDQMLLNQVVEVHGGGGPVVGVIGSKPPHRMKPKERKKVTSHDKMFIDIGATSRETAGELVKVGDPISFKTPFNRLPNRLFTGKALDNRLGCLVMIEVLKRVECEATVYGVGTVQEEVGLKGARTSAFKLNPDMALALDVTIAGDHPGMEEEDAPAKLGRGPAIILTDASGKGIITHPRIRDWLISTAEEEDIPIQLEVSEGGTTDATAIHLTREGIPAGVVSVPTRYIHTPVGVASMDDVENTVKLIVKALERL